MNTFLEHVFMKSALSDLDPVEAIWLFRSKCMGFTSNCWSKVILAPRTKSTAVFLATHLILRLSWQIGAKCQFVFVYNIVHFWQLNIMFFFLSSSPPQDAWFKIVALLAFVIGNSGFLISFIHTISGLWRICEKGHSMVHDNSLSGGGKMEDPDSYSDPGHRQIKPLNQI